MFKFPSLKSIPMIKFFKKIRQKLLAESKFSKPASPAGKYMIYAIGEIVLIVIGILIALQIDTWNQNKVNRSKEIEVLKDFQNELKFDLAHIEYNIKQNALATSSMGIVLEHLENDLPYHDSLNTHFNNATGIVFAELNGSVFETLKAEGLNLISNKDLRDSLVIAYGKINDWVTDQSRIYHDFMMDAAKNVFNTRFRDYWNTDMNAPTKSQMIPIDYEKLKEDQEYLYFLRTQRNLNFHYIEICAQVAQQFAKRLLILIEEELKKEAQG